MATELTPTKATRDESSTWHFRFEEGGWAIFTINEGTGEFSIQSDWGEYAHRWNVGAIGEGHTMRSFIATASVGYLLDKLSYGQPRSFKERFDAKATLREFRRQILEHRRDGTLTKEAARDGWDDLDKLFADLNGYNAESATTVIFERWPDSMRWLEEPYYHYCHKPSPNYVFLHDRLLPMFRQHLQEAEDDGLQLVAVTDDERDAIGTALSYVVSHCVAVGDQVGRDRFVRVLEMWTDMAGISTALGAPGAERPRFVRREAIKHQNNLKAAG